MKALGFGFLILSALGGVTIAYILFGLPATMGRFSVEPEDTYLSFFWISVLLIVTTLWGVFGLRLFRNKPSGIALKVCAGASLFALVGFFYGMHQGVI